MQEVVIKIIDRFKQKARILKQNLLALYYAYHHKSTGIFPKIIILLTLGYALSPIDLIPDFIPIIGWLDDLIIVPALITLSIKLIPAELWEAAKKKAEKEPLTLRRNWGLAIVFISIWGVLLFWIISNVWRFLSLE